MGRLFALALVLFLLMQTALGQSNRLKASARRRSPAGRFLR